MKYPGITVSKYHSIQIADIAEGSPNLRQQGVQLIEVLDIGPSAYLHT